MKNTVDLIEELSKQDSKSLSQKLVKLMEECGELSKEILAYEGASGCQHRYPDSDRINEEVADIILVASSIAISLGCDSNDISKMIGKKAYYWKKLIEAEQNTDMENLMFEFHITVDNTSDLETFKKDCQDIGVKPIILDLYTDDESIKDVMTSSHFKGNTTQASEKLKELSGHLTKKGYTVVREKVETVPWHPASNHPNKDNYYEAHFAFDPNIKNHSAFKLFLISKNIRLSKNTMKKNKKSVIMGTYRKSASEINSIDFQDEISDIEKLANDNGFNILEKPIVEYALHDSNTKHDKKWINNKQ